MICCGHLELMGLLFMLMEWDCLWTAATNRSIVQLTDDLWIWSHAGMLLTGENWRTLRKACPSATKSTTHPIGTDLGVNLGLCSEATNCLSHSMTPFNGVPCVFYCVSISSSSLVCKGHRMIQYCVSSDHTFTICSSLCVCVCAHVCVCCRHTWTNGLVLVYLHLVPVAQNAACTNGYGWSKGWTYICHIQPVITLSFAMGLSQSVIDPWDSTTTVIFIFSMNLRNIFPSARFQVLTAASMKMAVIWDVAPCSLIEVTEFLDCRE
jgi:hypothetical protein